MQVNDTVRAVHTSGLLRRAFFATVLSVQPTLPGDVGTNGEPTLTLGFLDTAQLGMVGGVDWHKAFKRITTVRHVSHDEVQQSATEYCWTDVLPRDGGPFALEGLNMSQVDNPPAEAVEAESTIGTIVHINHNNGLDVFHGGENMFRVHFEGEDFDFSDLFSAQVFVDAKPAPSIEGSPRDLLGHQMFGEDSEEVAKARYEIYKKEQAAATGQVSTFPVALNDLLALSNRIILHAPELEISPDAVVPSACTLIDRLVGGKPSAADLDAVAQQDAAKEATSGAALGSEAMKATFDPNSAPNPATNEPAAQ